MELSCESFPPTSASSQADGLRSAIHLASGTQVAIKRINPFEHAMFIYRTLREIKLLRHFQFVSYSCTRNGADR